MVSKLNSVFRHILGSDNQHQTRGSRKRPSESIDDVREDVLETPQAKRARINNPSDGQSSSSTTPLLKVASWIRRKASSFGETYFFKPVGDFVERSYPSPLAEPMEDSNHRQSREMRQVPNQSRLLPRPENAHKNTPSGVSFKQPGEPCSRKQLSSNPHHHHPVKQQPVTSGSSNGPQGAAKGNHSHKSGAGGPQPKGAAAESRGKLPNVSSTEMRRKAANVSKLYPSLPSNSSAVASSNRSKHKGYIPVREKLFPDPRRRVVVSQNKHSHTTLPHNKLAVNECVRLKERQQYQQLLQQYTMGLPMGLNTSRIPETTTTTAEDTSAINETGARPKTSISSNTSSTLDQTDQPRQSRELGTRVLPHQFSTRTEVMQAVRQRLHAPTSNLSPGTPATERNQPPATPAQPDFNDSDTPIITSVTKVQSPPAVSAFQKSLVTTPYLTEEWVKDLKARFESSVRIRKREIEEHESKLQHYEERRAKEQADVQVQIQERIRKAKGLPGVVEDVIYRPEEKEEDEDAIEIIDDEEEEEEEEEESDEEDDGVEEVDDEEDEFFELTEEMDIEIDNALNPNPSGEKLVSGFRLNITRRDMQTLAGLNWLNDEVMNFYFEMLKERSEGEGFPNVHVFNTFFYPKLLNSGYKSICRWTKRVDVFTKDLLLVPIHLGMHWCLAVIDFRNKTIVFYDSMGSHNQQCIETLRDWVVSEHADKKKQAYSMDGWNFYSERNIPQQMNGSDCGMFACKFAEYISRDAPITFTQHNMPYFRRRMVWEILHMKLL